MKIAIELYQIIPEISGGIVPQLDNLLSRAFELFPTINFLVYATPHSYRPATPLPPNVSLTIFPEIDFWPELEIALIRGEADILFRTYPGTETLTFPASRQLVLVPDFQHELSPEFFDRAVLDTRRLSFPTLINTSGAICVYSEHERDLLHRIYSDSPAEIVLVPPGPNLKLLQTDLPLTPAEISLIPQEPFFVFPANLWPHKNHRRLFAALEIALPQLPPNTNLVLTGDPTGWPELQTEFPHLPVSHLGFVSPGLLQSLYRQAIALTYFSLHEGFGMPLVEAFSLGIPVLCSNLMVLKEVGADAILSCDPIKPEAMAELMVRISREGELRQTLIEKGYRQAGVFSGDRSSRNFVEACQRLAGRPVDFKVQLQMLKVTVTSLAQARQHLEDKEKVIMELNTASQKRLNLINDLHSAIADLRNTHTRQQTTLEESQARALEQERTLGNLNQELQQTVNTREELQRRLEENEKTISELRSTNPPQPDLLSEQDPGEVAHYPRVLEKVNLELEKTLVAKQIQFEQSQQENERLTAELEIARRWASGGELAAIIGIVDNPGETANWTDWINIQGWAFSTEGSISSIEAFMDETNLGSITYRYPRPDVAITYNLPINIQFGFEGIVGLPTSIRPGPHKLRVQVNDSSGNRRDFYKTGYVLAQGSSTLFQRSNQQETGFKLILWLRSFLGVERRQRVKNQADQQFVYWKDRLLHYHLGILHHHPPRPWQIPARYSRTRPPAHPPSISIVTPSYNQAGFLERTLLSILDQHYPKLEYIVQDGGSKDGSAEILGEYANRLAHWESARDKGQSNALNLGFNRTTGEIMAYLNSDDLLLPGTLNYVARYFEKHPEVDVVYGQRVIIDEHGQEIGRWIVPPHLHDQPTSTDILSWADYIPQETMFWRRRIWDKVGGQIDESFQFAMDWELILRFRSAGARFARLPRFLGAFRVHSTQKSSAQISDLGHKEMYRLREQSLGYVPSGLEVHQHTLPYLRRHVFYHKLYRLGIIRY